MSLRGIDAPVYLAPSPRYSSAKSETIPPQFELPIMGTPSNFVIKLGRQRVKAFGVHVSENLKNA